MQKFGVLCSILLLATTPIKTYGQQGSEKPAERPVHHYQLRFDVEEVRDNGKITNSRTYRTMISTDSGQLSSIRTGNKIPIVTGVIGDEKAGNKQVQYLDIGVNIDIGVTYVLNPNFEKDANSTREIGDKLALRIKAEISDVAPTQTNVVLRNDDPVIRQNRWESVVLVTPGKPTVIFSSDNLDNKGKMQVELTATRME